jgi:hypothetical protein
LIVNLLLKKLVMAPKNGKLCVTSAPESVDDFLIQEKDFLFVFTNTIELRRFFTQSPFLGAY